MSSTKMSLALLNIVLSISIEKHFKSLDTEYSKIIMQNQEIVISNIYKFIGILIRQMGSNRNLVSRKEDRFRLFMNKSKLDWKIRRMSR